MNKIVSRADWEAGCPSCSLWTDGFEGTLPHLAARDVTLVSVSTGPSEPPQTGGDCLNGYP